MEPYYLLNHYSPLVSVGIRINNFLPSNKHPKGSSEIDIIASYVGESGLKIKELEKIANEHGLEERVR